MDKLLDSPWFLRFTALFLALLLFVTVADEKKQKASTGGDDLDVIRDVPVEVFYDNENLVVTGVPETVDVAIEGPINIVQTTTLIKDFSLYVDLTSLPIGEHKVRIGHENISEKLTVRVDPAVIDVVIEEKITKTFKVEPEFNKQLLASDFYVNSMEVEPATIDVTGAKSVIESISFVKATVSSESEVNQSFEQEARVRVLDRDLNKLDLAIYPEKVTVKVDIQENSKEVPIALNPKGTPPEGVTINELSTSEERIVISGPSKALEGIDLFTVDVDVSKVKKSGTTEVELKVPKGASKLSIAKLKVSIDVTTESGEEEKEEDENLEVPDLPDTSPDDEIAAETVKFEDIQVTITGLDRQFNGVLTRPSKGVTLTATAASDVVGRLQKSDFSVLVDASDVTMAGEYVYPITVKGPGNVQWTLSEEEATLKIVLA